AWRMAALLTSLVALAVIGGLLALRHPALTRPTSQTGPVPKRQEATPLRPRSRISVLVLNGNGMSGAAGTTATRLLGRGYHSAAATNAAVDNYATSLVLYRRGGGGRAPGPAPHPGLPGGGPPRGRPPPRSRPRAPPAA